jgi:hypothetical protein
VQALFGDAVESLELKRRTYVERSGSPEEYVELFRTAFGPVVALRASLAGDPRAAELDRDLDEFAARSNTGAPGGPAEYPYEYLLSVARKRRA